MLNRNYKYSTIWVLIPEEDGAVRSARILFFLTVFIVHPSVFAQVKLIETDAGRAFKSGEYEKALKEFNVLLEEYPDDTVTILRYIGLTHHRLGQYEKAIDAFKRALEIDPQNVPVLFYMASTYFKISDTGTARKIFLTVLSLAPGSLYGEWAERYLEAIEQQETEYERPGGPRLYEVFLQVSPQLDFNVPEDPKDGSSFSDDESFRFTEYASLGLRTKQLGKWMLGSYFSTYQSQNTKKSLRDFNLSTFNISPYINYTTTVFGKAFSPTLSYNFNYALLDYDSYSNSHTITATLNTAFTVNTLTMPYYRLSFDNFNDEGFDPSISSRDAVNNAFGIVQYLFFLERAVNIWLGYEFQHNDADGLNFNYNGNKIGAGFSVPIYWGLRGDVSGEYERDDYPDFQGPRDRETNRVNIFVRLARNIKGPVYGALSYSFTNEDSNYEVLEFDRHILTWSLFLSY
jgi:hypothetical protein